MPEKKKKIIIGASIAIILLLLVILIVVISNNEEREEGLFCVGAPIFNKNGKAIAAISISGPKARVFDNDFEEKVKLLKQCAQRVSVLTKEIRAIDE